MVNTVCILLKVFDSILVITANETCEILANKQKQVKINVFIEFWLC